MNGKLLYPFILVAGSLQAIGVTINAVLNHHMVNPWLAAAVSFLPIVFVFVFVFVAVMAVRPLPMPTTGDVETMPWWAPLDVLQRSSTEGRRTGSWTVVQPHPLMLSGVVPCPANSR